VSAVAAAPPGPLLEVSDLVKHFPVKGSLFEPRRVVHALDGVSLALGERETLGVVGESGCGKSTLARCVVRLVEPTRGTIRVAGHDVVGASAEDRTQIPKMVQIVFQDPYSSLNPRRTIAQTVADPLRLHAGLRGGARRDRVAELLAAVGMGPEFMQRYPHELSGGQRQRVAIARALAVGPRLIVCDEPVSALDVSIQAQVVNLLKRLQQERGIAYLFITHDLRLVQSIADRVAVMYLGEIVELAPIDAFRRRIKHPYSQALFAATPRVQPEHARRLVLAGDVPSPIDPPAGCRFHTRCPYRQPVCETSAPALRTIGERLVRCHFADRADFPPPLAATAAAGPELA
jgi:oligopeptide/dipeptide ABC transporter ATP-binding protein